MTYNRVRGVGGFSQIACGVINTKTGEKRWTSSYDVGTRQVIYDTVPTTWNRKPRPPVVINGVTISKTEMKATDATCVVGPVPQFGGGEWPAHVYYGCHYNGGALLDQALPEYLFTDAAAAYDACVQSALAEAYSSISETGVTLAEFGKTADMLKSPFKSARRALGAMRNTRKSKMKRGASFVDATASTWLEYRMGWKPLLYDITQTLSAIADFQSQKREEPIRRAKRTKKISYSTTFDASRSGIPWYYTISATGLKDYKRIVGCQVFYRPTTTIGIPTRSLHTFGLAPEDIANTMWELIPLSFVVDRFVQVGDWLRTVQGSTNVAIEGYYGFDKSSDLTQFLVHGGTTRCGTGNPSEPYAYLHLPPAEISKRITTYTRSPAPVIPATPVASPRSITLQQYADHAALIAAGLLAFGRSRGRL